MATKVVGLDLGAHTVKCCELVTTFRNFELVAFGSEPVEPNAEGEIDFAGRAAAAKRLLARRGLLNETVMVALPADIVAAVSLSFPFSQPKKVAQVLPFELAEALPFDLDDAIYDYQIIESRGEAGCTALVSYAKEEAFAEFLGALAAEGIDPKVISSGPLSWFNLYDSVLSGAAEGPVAVLDIGHLNTELAIFAHGSVRLVRDFPGGGAYVTEALAEAFRVNLEQAERGKIAEGNLGGAEPLTEETSVDLDKSGESRAVLIRRACRKALAPVVREVRRSLVAFETQNGAPASVLLLTGGTSQLRGIVTFLAAELGIEVRLLDATRASFNRLAGGGEATRPYLGKALALSMRAFSRANQSQINFRQGEHAYTGDFGFLRGRIITVAAAVLAIIVLGALGAKTREWVLQAEYQSLVNEVRAVSEAVLGFETDDAETLANTINNGVTNRNQLPETSAFEVLAEVSKELDFSLQLDLDRYEIDIERSKLTLEGKTASGGDVERIVDGLRKTRCFNSRVSKERVEKAVDDRTKFRLSATSSCT